MLARIFSYLYVLVIALTPPIASDQDQNKADLILHGGTIITMDEKNPNAEAVAVRGTQIIYVGSNKEADTYKTNETKFIDLQGATVVPGLIDAHAHLLSLGQSLERLDLTGTASYGAAINLVAGKVAESKPGQWILGRGWDQNKWPSKEFPVHDKLSRVSADNPVYLVRVDGHAALANKKALDLAGITKNTKDPDGGKIIRDAHGQPTGVFIDKAKDLVAQHIPRPSPDQTKAALLRASEECLRYGLTGIHDAGVDGDTIRAYKELIKAGRFNLRVYAMIGGMGTTLDTYLAHGAEIGLDDNKLTVRSIKLVMDGALGSRGAAFLQPYTDDPTNNGLILIPEQTVYQITKKALRNGFQVCVHAIGDKANHWVLNAFEKAINDVPSAKDPRLRVEHAQVLVPSDIPRFAQLGILPSMQPTHATSDMYWAETRVGAQRIKGAYAWRSLLDTGARIAAGSDFPVESVNPLWGIYAAVTRQDRKGWPEGGWHPEQRMTRYEALRGFTREAAYAAFEEDLKGSIQKGKLADMVLLSKDIMTIPPPELLKTEVLKTIVGGKVAYEKRP